MHICKLREDELPLILPLLRQVQDLHARALPGVFHMMADDAAYLAHWRSGIDTRGAFVLGALQARRPVGFLYGFPEHRDADAFSHARAEMVLDQICVDAAHRGQGIGRALVRAFEAEVRAAGLAQWRATHWSFNDGSAALFDAAGAVPSVLLRRKSLSPE